MSQTTITSAPFDNENLFTKHYLLHRVQQLDGWDQYEEAEEAFEALKKLHDREGDFIKGSGRDEEDTKDHWIERVLEILGYDTLGETTLPENDGSVDYLAFGSGEERRLASEQKDGGNVEGVYHPALTLIEAKAWGEGFYQEFSENRNYQNAANQIRFYLENTPETVDWGILTNGKKWRLYTITDTEYATDTYYEIDLEELLVTADLEEFMYFYAFFRPEAFREYAGHSFLDTVRNESEIATREIGENLQENVYDALEVLGRGFIEYNNLDVQADGTIDPSSLPITVPNGETYTLDDLKQQSLVFLYRLMFLLYAEGNQLIEPIPAKKEQYKETFSIDEMRKRIMKDVENSSFAAEFSEESPALHARLRRLFELVDEGNADLGIPPYNGGLFDPDKHSFLAESEIDDRHLAEVIHRLSTAETEEEPVRVDYSDLQTRHLGTVYEGLLQHHFAYEDGELEVATQTGERRDSGSYYTPDHVVTYMVEETIDPLLDEIRADLEAEGFDSSTVEYAKEFRDRVLDLRILDPAMGSAHFLTKATGYLTSEVQSEYRESESADWEGEDKFRRRVAKECIYGVDLNEMAVELAKVSMWLETLAADRPLAFLDHRLKVGNSLVGSESEELQDILDVENGDGENHSVFDFIEEGESVVGRLMSKVDELLSIDNETIDDVERMEAKHQELLEDEDRWRLVAVANAHTADRLGADVREGEYEDLSDAVDDDELWDDLSDTDWFHAAQETATEHKAFHWRLEFPEVFFSAGGNPRASPGFDAVASNPPYIKIQNLRRAQPAVANYLLESDYSTTEGRFDIYSPFLEQATRLAPAGRISYILPNKFFEAGSGEALREYLANNNLVSEILDFGQHQIFEDATTYTCILTLERGKEEFRYSKTRKRPVDVGELRDREWVVFSVDDLGSDPWVLAGPEERKVLDKLDEIGDSVGSISRYLSEGIVSGDNDVFFVEIVDEGDDVTTIYSPAADDTYPIENEMVKPLIRGDDIERYTPPTTDEAVIYPYVDDDYEIIPEHRFESNYPNAYNYLDRFHDRLADRGTENMQYQAWYALYRPREKILFENPKLITPDVCQRGEFTLDENGEFYLPNSGYAIVPKNNDSAVRSYLLAVLNSSVTWFYIYQRSTVLRGDYRRFMTSYLSPLPIPKSSPESDPDDSEERYEQAVSEYLRNDEEPEVDEPSTFLSFLGRKLSDLQARQSGLNLSFPDYLGTYSEAQLNNIQGYQPAPAVSDSIITANTDDYDGLRIGSITTKEKGSKLVIEATARYKPEDEDEYETDSNGFTETETIPVIEFVGLSEGHQHLLREYLALVDETGEGLRKEAAKTLTLQDRIEDITLPEYDDVADGVVTYLEKKKQAAELTKKIEKVDKLVDKQVYNLYGLEEEEIKIVESVAND